MKDRNWNDAGGTPGGLGDFLAGLAMVCAGAYLFVSRVMVIGLGTGREGYAVLAMLVGFGFLFYNGRSWLGWLLTGISFLAVVTSMVAHLRVYLQPTSLLRTLLMLGLLFGGLGLLARSLRPRLKA